MRRTLGLVALAAIMLFTISAGQALASHVQCGDVITQNTTLDSDLIDCPGDGLVIGADGVRLNLAGHMIGGLPNSEDTEGISADGFNDLVIRNGFVNEFEVGVSLGTSNSVLRDVTVTSCCGLTLGIRVVGSDNRVLRNVTTEGGGGMGVSGDRNLVGDNVIASQTEDDWFFVSGASDVIVRNDVRLVGGTVCRAFRFRLDQSLIARNTVTGTKTGVTEGECFGFLGTGEGTRLERNIVTGMSTGMDVVGNLQLVRNTASRNSWDGISAGTGVTVTRNTANDNGNLGIDASGAIDGGGNRARGNGNPAQCVGVRCK